jgi:hypothetical protein
MASPQVRNRCWRDFINDSRSGGVTIKFIDSGEVGCTIAERVIADEKKTPSLYCAINLRHGHRLCIFANQVIAL